MISRNWFGARSRHLAFMLLFGAVVLGACYGRAQEQKEAEKLANLLHWKAGGSVAEIGAGDGTFSVVAAQRVGPTGHVYSTELDPKKLAKLEELAQKTHNITAVKAGQTETNLPAECCDSIFMRRVYHHFTDPQKEDASLFQSLKPGGLLAIIDFQPGEGPGNPQPVKGVPENRGGHGMPKQLLVEELSAAGFQVVSPPSQWRDSDYCAIFVKK